MTSSVPEGVGRRGAGTARGRGSRRLSCPGPIEDDRVAWTEAVGRKGEVRTVEAVVATRAETDGLGLRVIRPSGSGANESPTRPSRKGPFRRRLLCCHIRPYRSGRDQPCARPRRACSVHGRTRRPWRSAKPHSRSVHVAFLSSRCGCPVGVIRPSLSDVMRSFRPGESLCAGICDLVNHSYRHFHR